MLRFVVAVLTGALALVLVAPAAADAPERTEISELFSGVDDECSFPIQVTVERTSRTTVYADGDVQRHTMLVAASRFRSLGSRASIETGQVSQVAPARSATTLPLPGAAAASSCVRSCAKALAAIRARISAAWRASSKRWL
jgi:chitodextrinase